MFQCSKRGLASTDTARYGFNFCVCSRGKASLTFITKVQAVRQRRSSLCPSDGTSLASSLSSSESYHRPTPADVALLFPQRTLVWMKTLSDRDDTQSSPMGDLDVSRRKAPYSSTLSDIGEEHEQVKLTIRNPGNVDWSPDTDDSSLALSRPPEEYLSFKDLWLQPTAEPEALLMMEPQYAEQSSPHDDHLMHQSESEATPDSACILRKKNSSSPLESANVSLCLSATSNKMLSNCPIEFSSSREVPSTESLPMTHAELASSTNLLASPIEFPLRSSPDLSEALLNSLKETHPRNSTSESQAARDSSLDSVRYPWLEDEDCSRPPTLVSYSTMSQATELSTPETGSLIEPTTAQGRVLSAPVGTYGEILNESYQSSSLVQVASRSLLSLNTDTCKPNRTVGNSTQRREGHMPEQYNGSPSTTTSPSSRTSSDSWSDKLARTFSGRRRLNPFKMIPASDTGQYVYTELNE